VEIKNIQESTKPHSIVYATKDGIEEKFFEDPTTDFSLVLIPNGVDYRAILAQPLQAKSIFTQLFFYQGHGLECFDQFDKRQQVTGGLIYTYKVDFDCLGTTKNYFLPEEQVRAQHILTRTTGVRSESDALVVSQSIRDLINENNFEELAAEHSEDPANKDEGGDLGWFGRGVMVPEFEEAAFALEKGEVSEPIKTQFGYHLIKLNDRREVENQNAPDAQKIKESEKATEVMEDEEESNSDNLDEEENVDQSNKTFGIKI